MTEQEINTLKVIYAMAGCELVKVGSERDKVIQSPLNPHEHSYHASSLFTHSHLYKPILIHPEDVTEQILDEIDIDKCLWNNHLDGWDTIKEYYNSIGVDRLRAEGIDTNGLIESGNAIRKEA